MNRRGLIVATWLLSTVSLAATAGAAFPVGGEYDSTARANAVDADASSGIAAFEARLAAAFALGSGGVVDFDAGDVSGNNVLDFDFGPAASPKRLRLSASDNLGHYTFAPPFFEWAEPISGDRSLGSLDLVQGGSDPHTYFIPTALTGGAAGEALTEVGFTLLSRRDAPQDVSATAQFSDGSSSSLAARLSGVRGEDDTFFHFAAPSGTSVTRLTLNFTAAGGPAGTTLDDFAFITSVVPDPAGAPCLAAAAMALCARPRRRPAP